MNSITAQVPKGVNPQNFQFQFLQLKELESNDQKVKAKFLDMLKDGFFYLEMPHACSQLLQEGKAFGETFYTSEKIKAAHLSSLGGYHDRDELQIESLYVERADWSKLVEEGIFSEGLVSLAKEMHALGVKILRRALSALEIPEKHWNELTGNLTFDSGLNHLSFNHYRAERKYQGLQAHKDFGFVTVLFVNSLGLEGKVKEDWIDVPPREGFFIINFGRCMEIITGDCGKVNAIEHRVRSVSHDRLSFGVFLDGKGDLPLKSYSATDDKTLLVEGSFEKYLKDSFEESYSKSEK